MTPDNLVSGSLSDQFQQRFFLPATKTFPHRAESCGIYLDWAGRLRRLFGQPNCAKLWLGENRGRDQIVIRFCRHALKDCFHKRHAFLYRHRGQVHPVCDIANRID